MVIFRRSILLIPVLLVGYNGCAFFKYPRDGIYLIPKDYVGDVIILFDQPDGAVPAIDNGLYVYTIPDDGILKVNGSGYTGIVNLYYYYVDKSGERVLIPQLRITGDRDPAGKPQNKYGNISQSDHENKIYVMATGGIAIVKMGNRSFSYTSFIVGPPKQSDKLYDKMEKRITELQRDTMRSGK